MPNRILKESICTSENLNGLTPESEIFFYRLITQLDDFGRMDARPAVLRAKCFPLRMDMITEADIKEWLSELEESNLINIYQVEGHSYLCATTWEKHQQRRAKNPKYPGPDGVMKSSDIKCKQMIAYVPVIENRESRIENRHPAPPAAVDGEVEKFLKLWESNTGRTVAPAVAETLGTLVLKHGFEKACDAARATFSSEDVRSPLRYMAKMLENKTLQGSGAVRPGGNGHHPNLGKTEVVVNGRN
jgi:hypothetical protein